MAKTRCSYCGKTAPLFKCEFAGGAVITCCCQCGVTLGLKIGEEVKDETVESDSTREG